MASAMTLGLDGSFAVLVSVMLPSSVQIVEAIGTVESCSRTTDRRSQSRLIMLFMMLLGFACGCRITPRQDVVQVTAGPETPLESLFSTEYERATHALRKGKTAKALSLLTSIAEANPSHGPALNNLGLIYYEKRQLPLAAAHFSRASELMPSNPTPLNNLGMAYEAGGKVDDALACYEQAHALSPASPLYLGNLVRLKIRLGIVDDLVIAQLEELAFVDDRPDWIDWADEQLAIHFNPSLDRGGDGDLDGLNRSRDSADSSARGARSRIIDLGLEGSGDDEGQGAEWPGMGSAEAESLPVPMPREGLQLQESPY
ncbi:MAG: tetratricopeptide repeat protein [Planctomycetota bacterium]